MIEYMLMNLGFLATHLGTKPEDVTGHNVTPDDSVPPKPYTPPERQHVGPMRGTERITIAESFYSPIRRTDFL